jgi:hypothetical protein
MKLYIYVLAVLTTLGCSGQVEGVYDIHEGVYKGGGVSSDDPASGAVDADVCVSQGQAAVTGSLLGSAFSAKDAIEIFDSTKNEYTLQIADYASACSFGTGAHAGSSVISIVYKNTELTSTAYDVTNTAGLSVSYVEYDATCTASKAEAAVSGSVTFGKLDKCGAQGTLDLMFGADHVTANFTASVCSLSGGAPTCH